MRIGTCFKHRILSTPHLGSPTIGAVRCSLAWQGRIRHTEIPCKGCRHVAVVVQRSHVHTDRERSELDLVLDQLVLQFPGRQNKNALNFKMNGL